MVKLKTCRDLITLCEKTQNPVTTVMGKRESAQEQDLTSHQKRFRDVRIRSKLPETHKFLVPICYFYRNSINSNSIKKVMYVHVIAKHDTCCDRRHLCAGADSQNSERTHGIFIDTFNFDREFFK